jgi:hypothetical protein
MNTYHQTLWGKSIWVDEETMACQVPLGLKHGEEIVEVEIQDKTFITSIKTKEDHDTVATRLILFFDREKVVQTCKKETFYEGWERLMCDCCVEEFELTEEEYSPNNENLKVEKVTTRYFVPIPTIRITVSY